MSPTYNFKGQVALVTGAGSGIGLAAASAFAKAGATVVLANIKEAAVRAAAQKLVDLGTAPSRCAAMSATTHRWRPWWTA